MIYYHVERWQKLKVSILIMKKSCILCLYQLKYGGENSKWNSIQIQESNNMFKQGQILDSNS